MLRLLLAGVLLTVLTTVGAPPADAAPQGWTPAVCTAPAGWDARICTNMYIDSSSNVNWIQECSTRTSGIVYAGTIDGYSRIKNANGLVHGQYMADLPANGCHSDPTFGIHVGNNAWVSDTGTLHNTGWFDHPWSTCQYVTGGAC